MTTDRIVEKLRRIKAHMESARKIGSDAEAEAFAAMMQRMMLEHEISMTDIEVANRDAQEPVDMHWIDYSKYGKKDQPTGARVRWREQLAMIIADAHFCRILVTLGSSRITLVGRKADCEIAEWMIVTMTRMVHEMALKEWWKEWRRLGGAKSYEDNRRVREGLKGFRPSYQNAFINRLQHRYHEELERMRREHTPHPSWGGDATSTALVRINNKALAVQDYMTKHYGDKKSKAGRLTRDSNAAHEEGWRKGTEAADRVNLRSNAVAAGTRRDIKQLAGRMTLENESITFSADGVWIQPLLSDRFRFAGSVADLMSILSHHDEVDLTHTRLFVRK